MRYSQYLHCAKKHLKGCKVLFQSYEPDSINDMNVWIELYYLCGYILEGVVVYSVYKLNGWPPGDDVCSFNEKFTKKTGLDFYPIRKDEKVPSGITLMNVHGHHFQMIAKNLLKINPSFNNVPYIGYGNIDPDIEQLIDDWNPKVRYKYVGANYNPFPNLNKSVIERLINTCEIIYAKTINI